MMIGTVSAALPVEKATEFLLGRRLVQVDAEGRTLAAVDFVGAQPGQRVLLAAGDAAARLDMACPTDAAVVAVVVE